MNAVAQHIPTTQVIDLDIVSKVVTSVIGCKSFELPKADVHIVPVSGGVDSSAVALVMKALFPDQQFLYVFSDTGVETAGTYEALDRIEQATGQSIERISAGQNLFEIISSFGSYLPSARVRYCTRIAKISPYAAFMRSIGSDKLDIATYVGIRADEGERSAADYGSSSQVRFPLKELGLDKRDVFKIVEQTIGIPQFYWGRSRSGCSVCVFARRSELIDQWRRDPATVIQASALEALPDHVDAALSRLPTPLAAQLGVGRNHLALPVPGDVLEREVLPWERVRDTRSKSDRVTQDMFGGDARQRMFVAVEFHRFWGGQRWEQSFQQIATYSTSLGGLKTALKHYWLHRVETREIVGCRSEGDVRDEVHLGIFEVLVDDAACFDVDTETGYTWQSDGTPLKLIRKVMLTLENILLGTELERLRGQKGQLDRWDAELLEVIGDTEVVTGGEVVWCELYERPSEAELTRDIDIEEAPEPCLSCSR